VQQVEAAALQLCTLSPEQAGSLLLVVQAVGGGGVEIVWVKMCSRLRRLMNSEPHSRCAFV
jgi:hypothetical protein